MDSNEHADEARKWIEMAAMEMSPLPNDHQGSLGIAQTHALLAVAEELRALREQGVRQTVFQPAPGPTGGFPENPPRDQGAA